MSFEFDAVHLVYLLVAISAGLFAEGIYLLFFTSRSYRRNINRRLQLMENEPNRETMLVQLRRERGLTSGGDFRLPLIALNRLILQSGLSVGMSKLVIVVAIGALVAFGSVLVIRGSWLEGFLAASFCGLILPLLVLKLLRSRRQKAFGAQFPDALDIIVRSLRAGHPVPIAIAMVARESSDPIGTEFGIVADEITTFASARMICRCSSPLSLFKAPLAAISVKFSKTFRRSFASASRCVARSARLRLKAVLQR